ncbi:MAG: hypothetical protein L0Z49_13435, partial [Actinobacteria bacterium]|nr:hypothetical protein [Actinomycetota bacterium]
VTVAGSGLRADIRLDTAYWSVVPAAKGETRPGVATQETLNARLAEHADQRNTVRLAIPGGDLVIGLVTVVAQDHIEIEDADNRHVWVPMSLILAVIRSTEFQ